MLSPVDIQARHVSDFYTAIHIEVIDPGVSNFLEFPVEVVRMARADEFVNADDDLVRGVFGYLCWGIVAPHVDSSGLCVAWYSPSFINWRHTVCIPPADVAAGEFRPNYARIWMRKNVKANIYTYIEAPGQVGGVILTPGLH